MAKTMTRIEKLRRLIDKGNDVLRTERPSPPNVIGFPTLDTSAFAAWQSQCLSFLESMSPPMDSYLRSFRDRVQHGYVGSVRSGIGILESLKEDIETGDPSREAQACDPVQPIENVCDKFHQIVRQLRARHAHRTTLDVQDEYDVQDLLHALLLLHFADIRPEEWTPSYAGKSSRMDFLVKREQVVIETKKAGEGLGAKELGSQLIEDIARYKQHPDCNTLVCFVYDPDGWITNPRGIEADLRRTEGRPRVEVWIRP